MRCCWDGPLMAQLLLKLAGSGQKPRGRSEQLISATWKCVCMSAQVLVNVCTAGCERKRAHCISDSICVDVYHQCVCKNEGSFLSMHAWLSICVCVCVCVSEQWTVLLFSTDTGSTSGDSSPVRVCVRACVRMHKCTINNHSIICSGILRANESQRTSRKTLPLTYSQSVLLTHYPICCLFVVVVVVCLRTIYFKLNMMKQTQGQWGTINLTRTHSCEITARDNRVASVTLTDPVYTESSLWT